MTRILKPKELDDWLSWSVFAICWNLAIREHPQPIISDLQNFMTLVQPPHLRYNQSVLCFAVTLKKHEHQFHQQANESILYSIIPYRPSSKFYMISLTSMPRVLPLFHTWSPCYRGWEGNHPLLFLVQVALTMLDIFIEKQMRILIDDLQGGALLSPNGLLKSAVEVDLMATGSSHRDLKAQIP